METDEDPFPRKVKTETMVGKDKVNLSPIHTGEIGIEIFKGRLIITGNS